MTHIELIGCEIPSCILEQGHEGEHECVYFAGDSCPYTYDSIQCCLPDGHWGDHLIVKWNEKTGTGLV